MADDAALPRYLLRGIAALLLVVQGAVHLRLWDGGYRSIDVIGPLFLAGGIAALVLAVAVLVRPGRVVVAAGLALSAGQIVGLLLSSTVGLFGLQTAWTWSGEQGTAFWSELLAVVVLAGLWRWQARDLRPRSASTSSG